MTDRREPARSGRVRTRHKPLTDPMSRFMSKVELRPDTYCWTWTGATMGGGYGKFFLRKDENLRTVLTPAHRWSYEAFIGPIPDGLQVDHLCRNRLCVNPFHLEPVTCWENLNRRPPEMKERKRTPPEFCGNGHPYRDSPNLHVGISGQRRCNACHRDRERARRAVS